MSDVIMQYKTMLDTSGFASGAQRMNSHLSEMGIRTQAASTNLGGLGSVMGTLGGGPATVVIAAFVALGGALYSSVQAAAAWETSMSGVAKTTGLAGPELAALSQELLTMSTNMPIAASELANIAQAGGSLGIAKDELGAFAEVASKMGIGFGMAADQAATAGAKILNSFGQEMNSSNLEKLGSVVNTMGDSFAATEPQVLDFLNRASFLNSTMGQSIPQVAALGTTLISTGMEAEVAATGIKSMLNMLTSETSKKGGMDNWAKLMGVSVDELKGKVADDLNSTLIETANKIVAIEDPVTRFQAAVAAAGTEGAPALLKLAGQQDNYAKALGLSNTEWEKAQSLQKTYEAQSGTLNSQWTMFTNTITMAATQLGTVMLPVISDGIRLLTDMAKAGMGVGESISKWTGIGQEGGISAKLASLGIKGLGLTVEQQKKLADAQEAERLAIAMGTEEGRAQETAKNEAAEQVRRAEESVKLAEAAAMGEKEAKEWIKGYGGAMEAGMTKLADDTWQSWEARADSYLSKDYMFTDASGKIRTGSGGTYDNSINQIGAATINDVALTSSYFTMSGGASTVFRLQDEKGNVIASATASELGIDTPGLPSSQQQAIGKLLDKALKGGSAGEIERLKLQGKYGAANALKLTISDVNIESNWDQVDSSKSIAKFMDANKDVIKNGGEELGLTLYNAMNSEIIKDSPTLTESLGVVMKSLSDPGSVPANMLNAGLQDLIDVDALTQAQADDISKSLVEATDKALDIFGKEMKSLQPKASEMMSMLLKGSVKDLPKFAMNVFQPEMMTESKFYLEEWNTGLDKSQDIAKSYASELSNAVLMHSALFTPEQISAAMDYSYRIQDVGKFLGIMSTETEQAQQKLTNFKQATEQQLSEFGQWQEGAESGVFKKSYIGASYGEGFDNYLKNKANEVNQIKEAQERAFAASQGIYKEAGYTEADAQQQIKTIVVRIDGTEAMNYMTTMDTASANIAKNVSSMTIQANTTQARQEVDRLASWVRLLNPVMQVVVKVDADASQIRASVERAISVAMANVRLS